MSGEKTRRFVSKALKTELGHVPLTDAFRAALKTTNPGSVSPGETSSLKSGPILVSLSLSVLWLLLPAIGHRRRWSCFYPPTPDVHPARRCLAAFPSKRTNLLRRLTLSAACDLWVFAGDCLTQPRLRPSLDDPPALGHSRCIIPRWWSPSSLLTQPQSVKHGHVLLTGHFTYLTCNIRQRKPVKPRGCSD